MLVESKEDVHLCCIQNKQAKDLVVEMFIKETLPGNAQSKVLGLYRSCRECKTVVDQHSLNRAATSKEDQMFDQKLRKAIKTLKEKINE